MSDSIVTSKAWTDRALPWKGWPIDAAILVGVAAAFRFVWLGWRSLWADEIFSVKWSELPTSYLLGPGSRIETNPPGYYVLLKGWMQAFGTSAFSVRALSALAATAAVLVVYGLGRRLGGRAFGVLAGLFLALDPNMVALARQARGYPLLALLASLALLGLCEALRLDTTRRTAPRILFAAAAIGSVLIHYTAVFFVAACFIGVAIRLLTERQLLSLRSVLAWAVVAFAIAAAISAPLLTAATMAHSANIAWIEPLSLNSVWMYFRELFVGRARPGLTSDLLVLVLLAAVFAGVARRRPTGVAMQILIVIPVAFLLMLFVVSLSRPLFIARAGAWLTTPVSMLLAWFALGFAAPLPRTVAIGVLALILGGLSSRVLTRPAIEDWRSTAEFVLTDPRCAGPFVTIGPHVMDAQYYEPRLAARPRYWVRLAHDLPDTAEAVLDRQLTGDTPLNPEELVPFLDAHPGAALAYRYGLSEVSEAMLADAPNRMNVLQEEAGIRVYCR